MDPAAALWELGEPVLDAAAPEDLAVFDALIGRSRHRIPDMARTFAEAAQSRAHEVFGLRIEDLDVLVDDILVAVDTFIDEGVRNITSGPKMAALRVKARTGAREGTPVEAIVMAYHLGAQWFWNRLREEAQPDERPALDRVTPVLQAFTQDLVLIMTQESFASRQPPAPEAADQVKADAEAVSALLAGRGDPASRWAALVLRPVPPAGVDVLESARQAARKAVPGAVGVVNKGAGLVLIPTRGRSATEVHETVNGAVDSLLVIGGLGHPTSPSGIRDACALAGDLAALALRTGRRTGVHGLGSLLLDYTLDRQPELRGHLAGLVADLPADLRETLELWLSTRDRKAVGAALNIHPNTVGYRLRRTGELTGVDPSSPEGSLTLHAALAARGR